MKKIILVLIIILVNTMVNADEKKKYFIVIRDNVNIRETPALDSTVLVKLKISNPVLILNRTRKIEEVNSEKGEWIFIDTCKVIKRNEGTVKGWIWSKYIVPMDDYKKVDQFRKVVIETWIGDYLLSYTFKTDGKYVHKKYVYDTDETNSISGVLYKYDKSYIAKDEDGEIGYFYEKSDGTFCSEIGECELGKIDKERNAK